MLNDLNLVIFDMDGLMFDTERRYCEEAQKKFDNMNIKVDMTALYDVIGTSLPIDMNKFNQSNSPNKVIEEIMHNSTQEAVDDMLKNGVPIKKGLIELLHHLNNKGITKAVATSTGYARAWKLMHAAHISDQFEYIITSAEVKNGKPAPDIFLQVCERAEISLENALVLEDSSNGARAAIAAGIRCIVIPDINPPDIDVSEKAYMIADSLLDVIKLI